MCKFDQATVFSSRRSRDAPRAPAPCNFHTAVRLRWRPEVCRMRILVGIEEPAAATAVLMVSCVKSVASSVTAKFGAKSTTERFSDTNDAEKGAMKLFTSATRGASHCCTPAALRLTELHASLSPALPPT